MKKINFCFMDFLVGLILIVCGVLVLKYRYMIHSFTGEWDWAQKYLGSQGTVVAIAFIGMFLIFVGVAFPLGAFKDDKPNDRTNSPTSTESRVSNPFEDVMNQASSTK